MMVVLFRLGFGLVPGAFSREIVSDSSRVRRKKWAMGESTKWLLESRMIKSIEVCNHAAHENYDEKVIKNRELVRQMSVPVTP